MDQSTIHLQAPWEEVKEKIKERNLELTDEDLEYQPGHESDLLNRLTGKLGKTPAEVKAYIESISVNQDMAG